MGSKEHLPQTVVGYRIKEWVQSKVKMKSSSVIFLILNMNKVHTLTVDKICASPLIGSMPYGEKVRILCSMMAESLPLLFSRGSPPLLCSLHQWHHAHMNEDLPARAFNVHHTSTIVPLFPEVRPNLRNTHSGVWPQTTPKEMSRLFDQRINMVGIMALNKKIWTLGESLPLVPWDFHLTAKHITRERTE